MANFRRKRNWKHAGACGEYCKYWKYGGGTLKERTKPSDRRRLEAAATA